MSTDIFIEQLVKREKTTKDRLMMGASVVASLLVIIIITMFPVLMGLFFPLAVVIIWVEFMFIKKFNIEFEYVLTGSELDVDRIVNEVKRKRQITVDVKNMKIVAPVDEAAYQHELKDYTKLYDFRSNREGAVVYAAMAVVKNEKVKILFEPKEEVLRSMKMFNPSQVKIKQV